jgi:hypothetical protein
MVYFLMAFTPNPVCMRLVHMAAIRKIVLYSYNERIKILSSALPKFLSVGYRKFS